MDRIKFNASVFLNIGTRKSLANILENDRHSMKSSVCSGNLINRVEHDMRLKSLLNFLIPHGYAYYLIFIFFKSFFFLIWVNIYFDEWLSL